jgi:hypothetical protein
MIDVRPAFLVTDCEYVILAIEEIARPVLRDRILPSLGFLTGQRRA